MSMTYPLRDAATMSRRVFRHALRYPSTIVMSVGIPAVLLLLFVGVFGDALGAGFLASGHGPYVDYVVPGILLMAAGYTASTTATAVNADITQGIIARFRTMAITRSAVLVGHVAGAVVRTLISVALLIGVALLLGFRPAASPLAWLAVFGVMALLVLALAWLAVAIGLAAKNPEGTSGFVIIVQVLPFVSSAFLPPAAMSGAVRAFAQHEPFTPIIDTLRGLLLGTPVGSSGLLAVSWCVGLALLGYLWSWALFRRDPNR
jgi:ABC-2 type transport system permease protein